MKINKPLARREDLTVEVVRGETLVYDLRNNKAHCLNLAAAAVWELCDGQTSIDEMPARLSARLGSAADVAMVQTAIEELAAAGLLQQKQETAGPARVTRRQVAAAAGILVPVVASVLVPTAAAAKSGSDEHSSHSPQGNAFGNDGGNAGGNGKGNAGGNGHSNGGGDDEGGDS